MLLILKNDDNYPPTTNFVLQIKWIFLIIIIIIIIIFFISFLLKNKI